MEKPIRLDLANEGGGGIDQKDKQGDDLLRKIQQDCTYEPGFEKGDKIRSMLAAVPKEYYQDKSFVIKAMALDSDAFQYAPENIRADREFILSLIRDRNIGRLCVSFLQYALPNVRSDRELMSEAIKREGGSLQWANNELRADKEFLLASIKSNAEALQYAPEEMRSNREIVLEAVKQNCWTLSYASDALKDDEEIVRTAIERTKDPLMYASKRLQDKLNQE